MKSKQIVDAWNQIEIGRDEDTKMLQAILAQKRVLDEKQERRDTAFLCFIQIVMFLMTLSIVAFVLLISPAMAALLLLGPRGFGWFY